MLGDASIFTSAVRSAEYAMAAGVSASRTETQSISNHARGNP